MSGLNTCTNRIAALAAGILAAASVGAFTPNAEADIIIRNGADIPTLGTYTIVGTELHVSAGVGEVRYDLSGNGTNDGRLSATNLADSGGFLNRTRDAGLYQLLATATAVASLSFGEEIPGTTYDPSAHTGGIWLAGFERADGDFVLDGEGNAIQNNGVWVPNTVAYLGKVINIGGNSHSAWMEIRLDIDLNDPNNSVLVVQRVAYNSVPGDPIFAGVPEPASLALLGAGGLLLLSRRRAAAV